MYPPFFSRVSGGTADIAITMVAMLRADTYTTKCPMVMVRADTWIRPYGCSGWGNTGPMGPGGTRRTWWSIHVFGMLFVFLAAVLDIV